MKSPGLEIQAAGTVAAGAAASTSVAVPMDGKQRKAPHVHGGSASGGAMFGGTGLLTLAARNLRRNLRRSVSTSLAVTFGSFAAALFGGYAKNIEFGLETNIVRAEGHMQIQHRDYLLFGVGAAQNYSVEVPDRIVGALRADPYLAARVEVVTPTLMFNGVAGNYDAGLSKSAWAVGVVPEDQQAMRRWNARDLPIAAGEARLVGTPDDTAVIGTGVARILQLCDVLALSNCARPTPQAQRDAGSQTPEDLRLLAQGTKPAPSQSKGALLQLLATTANGAPNVAQLHLQGVEQQGIRVVDDTFVGVHMPLAQRLLFGPGALPRATSIVLQLRNTQDTDAVRRHVQVMLEREFPQQSLAVNDFRTLVPPFVQTMRLVHVIFAFIGVLIMVIVTFAVSNTMSMAVVERTVEIGTLRAMGVRRAGIQRLFVLEGVMLGAGGSALGLVAAALAATGVGALGLTWVPPGYVTPMPLSIPVLGQWGLMGGVVTALVAVSAVSSYWPARRASRLVVVDALRHV